MFLIIWFRDYLQGKSSCVNRIIFVMVGRFHIFGQAGDSSLHEIVVFQPFRQQLLLVVAIF